MSYAYIHIQHHNNSFLLKMSINIYTSIKINNLDSKLINTIRNAKKETKDKNYIFTSRHS